MKIFGIDPGSRTTGYGIIVVEGQRLTHVDNGGISPSPKKTVAERLGEIYSQLSELLQQHQPTVVAIEEVFVANNARSALLLGQARGVALAAAAAWKIPVVEYSTRFVKQAIVGYGNADKHQIQVMVSRLLKLPEAAMTDAADALAIAITHSSQSRLNTRLK